jgi:hypothetical protein
VNYMPHHANVALQGVKVQSSQTVMSVTVLRLHISAEERKSLHCSANQNIER